MEVLIRLQLWVREGFNAQMIQATDGDLSAIAAILPFGILYGLLHAMTPGHSKSVLASYLIGSQQTPSKGLIVAVTLSATHVGMAVFLALLGAPLVVKTLVGAGRAPSLEAVSRGIIFVIGIWLVLRAVFCKSGHRHEGNTFGVVAGLIPCPLTLFVMLAASQRGTPGLGLIWATAMLCGVTLTLGATALTAVFARDAFYRLWSRHGLLIERISKITEAAAGVLLILLASWEFPF